MVNKTISYRIEKYFLRPGISPTWEVFGNKIDEIRALAKYNSDFRCSSVFCFTETWLKPSMPSELIDISGFSLIRHDRSSSDTNKSKGGGLCIYVNEKWCQNFTVRSTICNPDIELICVSFRPYYLPREFGQVHIFLVYIPSDANEDRSGIWYLFICLSNF